MEGRTLSTCPIQQLVCVNFSRWSGLDWNLRRIRTQKPLFRSLTIKHPKKVKAIGSAFDRFADDDVCQRSLWDARQEETSIKASKSGCGTREREKNKPLPSIFTPGSTDYQTDYLPYSGWEKEWFPLWTNNLYLFIHFENCLSLHLKFWKRNVRL